MIVAILAIAAFYASALLALYIGQRRLMYFPATGLVRAAAAGLTNTETLKLPTSDGETIVGWYRPAEPGHDLFLYFHGNGGALAQRADQLQRLGQDGSGFLAIDYRGYGGSTGAPSESGFIQDGVTAYAKALALGYSPARIVVFGESIGTGVAVAVAADHEAKALILDSAFSAASDVAAARYWMFPIRLLMTDSFRSKDRIGRVKAPKLLVHGSDDEVIPIAFGRALLDRAEAPKTFVEIPGAGHVVIWQPGVLERVKAWLAGQPQAGRP